MSRFWTEEELQAASRAMKAAGHMSYEAFCEELERQDTEPLLKNQFEEDYTLEQSIWERYKVAEANGNKVDMENAKTAHSAHVTELQERGKVYCRLYREYELSRDSGNGLLDINDAVWDKDVAELVYCMRKNGVRRFTFSSTWSGAVETAWLFQKNGCRLMGLAEINGRTKKILSEEHEKAHGYVFELEGISEPFNGK